MDDGRAWYTTAEAADKLGLSVITLQHQIQAGRLRAQRAGPRIYLIAADEIERYRAESKGKPGRKKG